ncbi:hypothetical protein [Thermococcus sp. JCM 11816]|uniref:hypothetical protein n=1 Tax=Thermococcus sp. (strain JCM 11816 / KS-1) TaxID=1295125 RepID=UPI0034660161
MVLWLAVSLQPPQKPVVRNVSQQKNYGLLTPPGLFKKVQRMSWDQEVSTIIMFDNQADKEKAVEILDFLGAKIKYNYHIIPPPSQSR